MRIIKAHDKPITAIAFSSDGRLLASCANEDVALWDAFTGDLKWKVRRRNNADHLAFHPQGSCFVMSGFRIQDFRLWNVRTRGDSRPPLLDDEVGTIFSAVFAPDGSQLVAARSADGACICRWRESALEPLPNFPTEGLFTRLVFSPDGRCLAGLSWSRISLLDSTTGELQATCPNADRIGPDLLDFAPDGKTLGFGRGTRFTIWHIPTMRVVTLTCPSRKELQQIAFSPCGGALAGVGNGDLVTLWDTESWQVRERLAWGIGRLKCLAFAPDGTRAAVGGHRGEILIWDLDL